MILELQFIGTFGTGDVYGSSDLTFRIEIEHQFGEVIFEILLNCALERTRTEILVITLVGDEVFCFGAEIQFKAKFLHTLKEVAELDVDDLEDSVAIELVEHDNIVDSVQELWRKDTVECLGDHTVGLLLADRLGIEANATAKLLELT